MSYAIPLAPHPRLEQYKKLAKDLLRASSDASTEEAVRAWAVRWLESSGCFREARQAAAVFPEQRSPLEIGERFYEVVDALVAAGAEIGSLISGDRRMMAALLGNRRDDDLPSPGKML